MSKIRVWTLDGEWPKEEEEEEQLKYFLKDIKGKALNTKEFLENYKRENGDCHFKFEGYVLLVVNVDWSEVTEYLDDNGGFYSSQFKDMERYYYTF